MSESLETAVAEEGRSPRILGLVAVLAAVAVLAYALAVVSSYRGCIDNAAKHGIAGNPPLGLGTFLLRKDSGLNCGPGGAEGTDFWLWLR
jgi:hypothetical protein